VADKTFNLLIPPTKAVDNGDGTFSPTVDIANMEMAGSRTISDVIPPTKVTAYGDGTFALAMEVK